ncbi:MAG: Hsp20/alpha crystallin family protein [Gammaproteobacteria bacterium]|nr:Hsp20/alpha crystallin family protein [Gammaproteobacteria bacterium]
MNFKKLSPWNWFKTEEQQATALPTSRSDHFGFPVTRLHREIDHLFDDFFRGAGFPSLLEEHLPVATAQLLKPKLDISETDEKYEVRIEVPGVDKDNISIDIDNDTLTIRGEKKMEKENKSEKYHFIERSYGSFQRVLALPADADRDLIDANFKDGVLRLTITKNPDKQKTTKTIAIEHG